MGSAPFGVAGAATESENKKTGGGRAKWVHGKSFGKIATGCLPAAVVPAVVPAAACFLFHVLLPAACCINAACSCLLW